MVRSVFVRLSKTHYTALIYGAARGVGPLPPLDRAVLVSRVYKAFVSGTRDYVTKMVFQGSCSVSPAASIRPWFLQLRPMRSVPNVFEPS